MISSLPAPAPSPTTDDGETVMAVDEPGRSAVPPLRLQTAKKAYTTRFLADRLDRDADGYHLLTGPDVVPGPGDVVLARVESVGQLLRLESPTSRRQALFVGDEVIVAYGNRYAADNVLAEVPSDLGPCELVAAGGMAGKVLASHDTLGRPTRLVPVGLLADADCRLNLRRFAPHALNEKAPAQVTPHVVAVLGTSMNSGKSTTAACFTRGLTSAGLRVAAGKITGTGAGGDPTLFQDAGAVKVLDFTDFGYASTFRLDFGHVRTLLASVVNALAGSAPQVIVIEIADGLYQGETRQLLADPLLHSLVDTVMFAATDALGAVAGVAALRQSGLEPAAVTGTVTSSPLATQEATAALGLPLLETFSLTDPKVAMGVLTPYFTRHG